MISNEKINPKSEEQIFYSDDITQTFYQSGDGTILTNWERSVINMHEMKFYRFSDPFEINGDQVFFKDYEITTGGLKLNQFKKIFTNPISEILETSSGIPFDFSNCQI